MEWSKFYDKINIPKKWVKQWEKDKIYKIKGKGKTFSIDTPPPTVSGQMHVGHAFSYAQGDFIARYHRMKGENIFYPFGTDDNGLPTERLVEKLKKIKSVEIDREKFRELCLKTINELKSEFIQPWKDLGVSCDFEGSYSTIDKNSQKTSQLSFIELYNKGKIYNENAPISWCPNCQTAIAQAEFEDLEMSSFMNEIIFNLGGKELVISTSRPELLGACVAIIVNPNDERYKKLVGKYAKVPLYNHEVLILADERADPEKGTGIVMCCTFGDKTDAEWWYKHKLPIRVIINKDGTMNEHAGRYKGLRIMETRKNIIEDLKKNNLLIKQTPIKHHVNVHDKCRTEIEIIKAKQWFIRILDEKEELIGIASKIKWYPEFMKKRYEHWVQNLTWDWCISRQRHFGVPFPLWYCKKCEAIKLADEKNLPVDPIKDKPKGKCKCGSNEFIPEYDVMDTWATSSLTPQIALNWIDNKNKFEENFPMSLRMQAHDIIRTWAFYTIVKALYGHNKHPWNNIMISGFVTLSGEKMSKSKGNVVDPILIMQHHGPEPLRFWAAGSKLGEDMDYSEKDLITGEKLLTKLWNASNFCIMNLKGFDGKKPKKFEIIDIWLLSKLNKLIKDCTEYFDNYEYSKVKFEAENFFWHTFCDNYLEIIKDRLYNETKRGKESKLSAQFTLYASLLCILKLLAPILPFITEEMYSYYFKNKEKEKSIHLSKWPQYEKAFENKKALEIGDLFIKLLTEIRQYKAKNKKPLTQEVIVTLEKKDYEPLKDALEDFKAATRAKEIKIGKFEIIF